MGEYLTKQEAADFLGIKYPAITYLLVSKQLPHIRRAGVPFIHREVLHTFKEAQDNLAALHAAAQSEQMAA